MAASFNKAAITSFGARNAQMPPDAPSCEFGPEFAALSTYLDCRVIRQWGVNSHPAARRSALAVIDVGAGKGRVTTHLSHIAAHCVAIEPHKPFYDVLAERCGSANVATHNCSLAEYARLANRRFDIVWISGVFPYMDDGELREALSQVHGLMAPAGLLINRERVTFGDVRFHEDILTYDRPPRLLTQRAEEAGLKVVRYRRAYPPNPVGPLARLLPHRLRDAVLRISYHRVTYPLWHALATCTVKPSKNSSGTARLVVYLMKKKEAAHPGWGMGG